MAGADLGLSVEHYRELALRYDARTHRIDEIRNRAIDALAIRSGDVVLDAGCGTGWCLPRLIERVGEAGSVIAFDPSPEMLAIARERLNGNASQAHLLEAPAQSVRVTSAPDAILFSFTHDLISSPEALDNVLKQARPGARVSATGTKFFSPWLFPANWYLRYSHRGYLTNWDLLHRPWSLLSERLDEFRVATGPLTQHYIATGRVRAR